MNTPVVSITVKGEMNFKVHKDRGDNVGRVFVKLNSKNIFVWGYDDDQFQYHSVSFEDCSEESKKLSTLNTLPVVRFFGQLLPLLNLLLKVRSTLALNALGLQLWLAALFFRWVNFFFFFGGIASCNKTLFSKFSDHWSPKIAGEINSMHLKLVKVQGDFVWHHHDTEDELFLVTKGGPLHMKIRDPDERTEVVDVGEFIIIPKGVEHCPMAVNECEIILLEPKSTLNTGNVKNDDKTVELLDTLV